MSMNRRIKPWKPNPFYWQYNNEPILLCGGAEEDAFFLNSEAISLLDQLHNAGGNYVRCALCLVNPDRESPFQTDSEGAADLSQLNPEYWNLLETFLDAACERDLIVQLDLWRRDEFSEKKWAQNPFNPANNRNYDEVQAGLHSEYSIPSYYCLNPFFKTIPQLENNQTVFPFQKLMIDAILEKSLHLPNIIYCIDDEAGDSILWAWFWAKYIRAKAAEQEITDVQITEMLQDCDKDESVGALNRPDLFSYVDVSLHNHKPADEHWEAPAKLRMRMTNSGDALPVNSVKIYGAHSGRFGSNRDAQERFWRNVFNGFASVGFHHPGEGLGLNETALRNIRALRMLMCEIRFYACEPNNSLLERRSWNEAFCFANPGREYAVFFADGGDVHLDVGLFGDQAPMVRWLKIKENAWYGEPTPVQVEKGSTHIRLCTPEEEGYWIAIVHLP